MKEYIVKNGKKLRCGITTGTCATAAATAAVQMLLSNDIVNDISVKLPGGEYIKVNILEPHIIDKQVSCCVKKDSGDDPDATDGIFRSWRI